MKGSGIWAWLILAGFVVLVMFAVNNVTALSNFVQKRP